MNCGGDSGDCAGMLGPYWVPRESPRLVFHGLTPTWEHDHRPNAIGGGTFGPNVAALYNHHWPFGPVCAPSVRVLCAAMAPPQVSP